MPKTLQVVLDEEVHRQFKLWCISKNTTMAEFIKKIIDKSIAGFNPDEIVRQVMMVETCRHVEMKTASGADVRLPIPNHVVQEGNRFVITVPDDTSEEDIALIGTIPNSIVKTNKEWRTEIPLEVLIG